jgi:hypothetical protein
MKNHIPTFEQFTELNESIINERLDYSLFDIVGDSSNGGSSFYGSANGSKEDVIKNLNKVLSNYLKEIGARDIAQVSVLGTVGPDKYVKFTKDKYQSIALHSNEYGNYEAPIKMNKIDGSGLFNAVGIGKLKFFYNNADEFECPVLQLNTEKYEVLFVGPKMKSQFYYY